MSEPEGAKTQPTDLPDDELPVMTDPSLGYWKDNAKALLTDSVKSIEEAAKQLIGVGGILEGLYFHAIAYSNLRGQLTGSSLFLYLAPIFCWTLSLALAVLVYFPRPYRTNINSARASRETFERVVRYKHNMLKVSGIFLAIGCFALAAALGSYLAG